MSKSLGRRLKEVESELREIRKELQQKDVTVLVEDDSVSMECNEYKFYLGDKETLCDNHVNEAGHPPVSTSTIVIVPTLNELLWRGVTESVITLSRLRSCCHAVFTGV